MKVINITNGTQTIPVQCTPNLNTHISEECMLNFSLKEPLDSKQVVLNVILMELEINKGEWYQWSLVE